MVYISRIYTRAGDEGETSLGNGQRVSKTHPRITAYGTVDELNAVLGLARLSELPSGEGWNAADWLSQIQNDLFDVGADLCVPEADPETPPEHPPLRVTEGEAKRLEQWIDAVNDGLEPLTSFILPAGSEAAARLHHARTVARRAEIEVMHLAERESINPQVLIYLNRLSDFLFVLARCANDNGTSDVLWVPGAGRVDDTPLFDE